MPGCSSWALAAGGVSNRCAGSKSAVSLPFVFRIMFSFVSSMFAVAQTEGVSRAARFPAFQGCQPGCFRHPENRQDRTQRGRGLDAGIQAGRLHFHQAQPRAAAGNRCDPVAATLQEPHTKPRDGTPCFRLPNLKTNCLLILHNLFQSVLLRPGLMAILPSELVRASSVIGVSIIRKPESRTVGENGIFM